MASPSVSFRISRSAEDLAGTLHLLSQRLVQLEQRLALLEAREREQPEPEDPCLDQSLENAERLLLDCRSLLEGALQHADTADTAEAAPAASESDRAPEFQDEPEASEPDPASEAPAAGGGDPGDQRFDAIPLFLQQEGEGEAVA